MNEQIIILFFLIFGTGATLYLYVWKAKKEMEYKKDERWQLIQTKAIITANYLPQILIALLAIIEIILMFLNIDTINITLTLSRVITYALCLFGLRNVLELFALIHFDNKL